MANTLLTPSVIARAALATLYENTVAAQLVHRDYDSEFVGAVGDTITIREPAVFEAEEFDADTGINIQDATENGIPVRLNHHADVSFAVSSRQRTLELADFRAQLLNPAMEAISQKIDRDVLGFRNDITKEVGTEAGSLWDEPDALVQAGVELDVDSVPEVNRRAIVGPRTRGKWLSNDLIKRADRSGSTAGLRQGSIGSDVFGFSAYMSQNIGQPPAAPEPGQPTTEVSVAFHRTAAALVTRQLELPMGAQDAAIEGYNGFGIRVVFDYDIAKKKDIVSLDVLYGVKTLDPRRAVLIKGADAA
ncbi:P22 phage major capsid protein family protein [Microbacterium sp. gxy059]|uniref:P22 phage major capsid protein family protein n=1 Tax=Microbacterium sp. gxy059 TaxID=2957199 RepID=UPI003D99DC11